MEFFLSGEVDALVIDLYLPVRKRVEDRLNSALADQDYGPAIREIGIIPIIASPDWKDFYPERRLFQRKRAGADYRLKIDFEKFRSGNEDLREKLLLGNILAAVRDLSRKAGRGFRGRDLINDILLLYAITEEELTTL